MRTELPDEVVGADDREIGAVAELLPTLPNIPAALADRFAQAVRSVVEKRARDGWAKEEDKDVGVFVFVGYPRSVGGAHGAAPFVDLGATEERLLGRLFFGNRDMSSGRVMDLPVEANEIIEWLEEQSLGNCPVVIVYRSSMKIVARRLGTRGPTTSDAIRDQEPDIGLSGLVEALDYFHVEGLLTPTCCPDGVWEPKLAQRYIPGPFPERSIQGKLVVALNYWFRGLIRAEREDSTKIGRIDVRLLRNSVEGPLMYWAIVELKVVKSYGNAQTSGTARKVSVGTNVEAIVEGIKQAWAYRENRKAEEGLLEVYDLRDNKGEDLMAKEEIREAMRGLSLSAMRMLPLFGCASDARRAGFSGV